MTAPCYRATKLGHIVQSSNILVASQEDPSTACYGTLDCLWPFQIMGSAGELDDGDGQVISRYFGAR